MGLLEKAQQHGLAPKLVKEQDPTKLDPLLVPYTPGLGKLSFLQKCLRKAEGKLKYN
jgi:hypothetical protein